MTFPILLTYGLLTLSLTTLWFPKFRTISIWQALCAAAICCGLWFDFIQPLGVLFIAIFAISGYFVARQDVVVYIRVVLAIVLLAVSFGLSLHIVPGFSNPKVMVDVILSEGAMPYTKYLNFDKAIVGLFLLGLTFNHLLSSLSCWLTMLKKVTGIAGITIVIMMILSLTMGYVRFDPKWSPFLGIWAWSNLFFTCIAEESIFRGFIQRYLVQWLERYPYGAAIGIFIAAVLFGLAHYPGGMMYVLLATVAGIGYGWAYHHSKSIEASIITHFCLNLVHFLFFTYPALASALR